MGSLEAKKSKKTQNPAFAMNILIIVSGMEDQPLKLFSLKHTFHSFLTYAPVPTHMSLKTVTVCCTPSFRNCIFQNLTFLKHHKKNMTISSFCNPKVVKSAAKTLKKKKAHL